MLPRTSKIKKKKNIQRPRAIGDDQNDVSLSDERRLGCNSILAKVANRQSSKVRGAGTPSSAVLRTTSTSEAMPTTSTARRPDPIHQATPLLMGTPVQSAT